MDPSGYMHQAYAESLSELGNLRVLPSSGSWILTRAVKGSDAHDGMGGYPIFSCRDWSGLPSDFAGLSDLVCISLVTDPFGDYAPAPLRECFPDLMIPFKQHFVVDLNANPGVFLSSHHRRNIQKALRSVTVLHCQEPTCYGGEWTNLYSQLIRCHGIRGIAAFSERALRRQLEVPGVQMLCAELDGETVGMILWMVQNEIAYYRLAVPELTQVSAIGEEIARLKAGWS
jgi:hypothetical protein